MFNKSTQKKLQKVVYWVFVVWFAFGTLFGQPPSNLTFFLLLFFMLVIGLIVLRQSKNAPPTEAKKEVSDKITQALAQLTSHDTAEPVPIQTSRVVMS